MASSYSFFSQEPHYLEACHLCGKHLGFNSDIFMYRGDTPFCSKECRQEQIEMDESTRKKAWKLSSSSSSSTSSSTSRSVRNSDSSESSNKTVRSDTVAVA